MMIPSPARGKHAPPPPYAMPQAAMRHGGIRDCIRVTGPAWQAACMGRWNNALFQPAFFAGGRTAVTSISTSQPGLARWATPKAERVGRSGCAAVPKNWV